ncbi:TetR/AcrR family transcriptional regulator C-terminal domain-containing protein [Actinoplanes sp. NPDC000266]
MARGRPPSHTRDQVVDAAVAIADAEGLSAVTMRRVATEIGAGAMSLYTYVPTRDFLIDLMVDRVGGTAARAELTGEWRADLLAIAGSQRALMLAHPWLPSALPNRSLTGRNTLAYLERGLAALAPTGLDGATRLELIALVTGFVASFVTSELSAGVPQVTEPVTAAEFPHLVAAFAEGAPAREPSFERLAAWMITGLVTQARDHGTSS